MYTLLFFPIQRRFVIVRKSRFLPFSSAKVVIINIDLPPEVYTNILLKHAQERTHKCRSLLKIDCALRPRARPITTETVAAPVPFDHDGLCVVHCVLQMALQQFFSF